MPQPPAGQDTLTSPANRVPAIIDLEASGFGADGYPIEVGAVRPDGQRYSALIRPYPEWTHWCPQAESVHGISQYELWAYGKPGRVVMVELSVFLQGQTVYSDCWVLDHPWLTKLSDRARCPASFWLSPLEMIMSEAIMEHWQAARDLVSACFTERRHRASTDAWFIQQVYLQAVELAAKNSSLAERQP